MKHQEINFDSKSIHIFDNLFSFSEISHYETFINKSIFRVGGGDKGFIPDSTSQQIYSNFSASDVEQMNFVTSNGYKFLENKFNLNYQKTKQIRVNLSTSSERNSLHTDGVDGKTLIYYPNSIWRMEWAGHTLFMDEHLEDVKCTCLYKPGRIVLFDSQIPHMILTPNSFCPVNRYSLVFQYK
jgi:hypothetical protein